MNTLARPHRPATSLILLLLASTAGAADEQAYPVAGLTPWQRPVGAPTVTAYRLSPEASAKALRGVSSPVPASVSSFLKDQGPWFNPFLGPGMTGPYDLRGWHAPEKAGKS